jgi:hypothetical protein
MAQNHAFSPFFRIDAMAYIASDSLCKLKGLFFAEAGLANG